MGNNAKKEFLNNIIIQMAACVDRDILQVLEQTITAQLVRVSMEGISTLPQLYEDDADQINKQIIQLFIYKKRIKNETKEHYLRAIKRLIVLIHKPLTFMDEPDIAYYLHWYETRTGRMVEASTYNNERRFLSSFFNWMIKERMITYNPVECIEPKKEIKKPIDYFKVKEFIQLRDTCKNARERALLEVLRSTGARIGELVQITTDQIDWDTGDILIQSEKSNRYRTIWLDEEARHYLEKYLSTRKTESPYLFPRVRAPYDQISTRGLYTSFKAIGKRAGVKFRYYPHKMRKTLGMQLKNRGVDIGTIQEIMGHASPAVTARYYAQSTPQALRYVRERVA